MRFITKIIFSVLYAVLYGSCVLPSAAAEMPFIKVTPATITVAQFGADDKEIGKAPELSDGNDRTRWICRTPQAPLYLRFDMGKSRTVAKLRFANYFTGNNVDRGFKSLEIFIGDKPLLAADNAIPLVSKTMAISDAKAPSWTDILLDTPVKGQYVTLRVMSNWGAPFYAANELEIYSSDADAGDAPLQAVLADPIPPVIAPLVAIQRNFQSYTFQENAENKVQEVQLTIPEGLKTIRGLLVVVSGYGGDSRLFYQEPWYSEFLFMQDFAFIGTKGFSSHVESYQVLLHSLQEFAKKSGHSELLNVPFVSTGFSAGAGFAGRLLLEAPERVIAVVPVSARLNFTGITPSAAQMATPACIISGELETAMANFIKPTIAECRPQGALYGWITLQGIGHARVGQEVLAMPYLETAIRLRYPSDGDVMKGPLQLKPLSPEQGWLADNSSWQSGLVKIAPVAEFIGDIAHSSWLPSEDIAFIYRAYSSYNRPFSITVTNSSLPMDPGCNVPILLDMKNFPNWKKLELFDGAKKIAEVTDGPAQFTAQQLNSGFHVFSVLATDDQQLVRTSNPVLVIVRKLPVTAP